MGRPEAFSMRENRKRPGATFWATAALAAALAYPVSFGPACWISSRCNRGERFVSLAYRPIARLLPRERGDSSRAAPVIRWYSRLGARDGWEWILVADAPCAIDTAEWHWERAPW